MNADFICKKINKKQILKLNLVIENDKGVENFDVDINPSNMVFEFMDEIKKSGLLTEQKPNGRLVNYILVIKGQNISVQSQDSFVELGVENGEEIVIKQDLNDFTSHGTYLSAPLEDFGKSGDVVMNKPAGAAILQAGAGVAVAAGLAYVATTTNASETISYVKDFFIPPAEELPVQPENVDPLNDELAQYEPDYPENVEVNYPHTEHDFETPAPKQLRVEPKKKQDTIAGETEEGKHLNDEPLKPEASAEINSLPSNAAVITITDNNSDSIPDSGTISIQNVSGEENRVLSSDEVGHLVSVLQTTKANFIVQLEDVDADGFYDSGRVIELTTLNPDLIKILNGTENEINPAIAAIAQKQDYVSQDWPIGNIDNLVQNTDFREIQWDLFQNSPQNEHYGQVLEQTDFEDYPLSNDFMEDEMFTGFDDF